MEKQTLLKILGAILVLITFAGIILQIAIMRNGPAVLDAVDQITGGSRKVVLAHRENYGLSKKQYLVVFTPTDPAPSPLPVILFSHGGSWNKGDPKDYNFLARAFVPEGFVVVLAAYRLHPEAIYPAMLQDTASAIAWTQANISRFGGDPARITVSGHSAGAYNVMMAALEPKWLSDAGGDSSSIAGVVGLAGPYDFWPFDSASTKASFGHADDPALTQPINHVRSDAPAVLLIHGEADTLVRPRNSKVLAENLDAVGGSVQTMYLEGGNHNQPLLSLASPWRRNPRVFDAFINFARSVSASASVNTEVP